jgi:NAD(P)-dependent dehydrogenase (short-subunit alcohol dehydrogenase family)
MARFRLQSIIRATKHLDVHLSTEVTSGQSGHAFNFRPGASLLEVFMKRFAGKVAVITGGNSGIGLATAKRFSDEGAKVAISGRSQKTLDEAVKYLGNGILAVKSDVAKLADLDRFYSTVAQKFGKIDVLFVNAGVAKFVPVQNADEAHYDEIFNTNVKGAYFTIQKALPHLNDGASIVLNTSVAGIKGTANASVYSATKAALRSFSRTLTTELVERGIRINSVAPGPIETPIFGRVGLSKEQVDEFAQKILSSVPLKRFGQPEEVASAVAFLASSDASYITGVELYVDGGMGQV